MLSTILPHFIMYLLLSFVDWSCYSQHSSALCDNICAVKAEFAGVAHVQKVNFAELERCIGIGEGGAWTQAASVDVQSDFLYNLNHETFLVSGHSKDCQASIHTASQD